MKSILYDFQTAILDAVVVRALGIAPHNYGAEGKALLDLSRLCRMAEPPRGCGANSRLDRPRQYVVSVAYLQRATDSCLPVSCIGLNATFARTLINATTNAALEVETGRWITAAYSLTLATNLLTTRMTYHHSVFSLAYMFINALSHPRIQDMDRC